MTATNVGFGFWSHDIVGPDAVFDNSNQTERYELYTRWLQWGAWSGTMRSHDRGMARGLCDIAAYPEIIPGCALIEMWHVPQLYFLANRRVLQDRVRLIPYIYTATRQAFDTGVSLLRPMYYDFPENDMAYVPAVDWMAAHHHHAVGSRVVSCCGGIRYSAAPDGSFAQYMFGDDLMVAPVVVQSDYETTMATTTIWIPPGMWIERDTGRYVTGASDGSTQQVCRALRASSVTRAQEVTDAALLSCAQTRAFFIEEVPVYVKAGAVIPTIPLVEGDTIGVASRQYTTLEFNIYPGAMSGSGVVYEDDGATTSYVYGVVQAGTRYAPPHDAWVPWAVATVLAGTSTVTMLGRGPTTRGPTPPSP